MFKDMKTGPYCRQNCDESNISVERLWSQVLYLCIRMTDVEKLLLVEDVKSCVGNPVGEVRKPCYRGSFP